jgi:hypothetical protein
MIRPVSVICILLLAALPAQASESLRRINGCMSKRMSADKAISYNDAKRACVDELKALNAKNPARTAGGGEATGD